MAKWVSLSVSGEMGEKSVKCDICGKYEDETSEKLFFASADY
jgi:hypothetical protein